MTFRDRIDAGRQLAKRLSSYANRGDVLVLGIPRGGVTVAYEIARALNAPLDILLSGKLGVPGQEELAFGAIAADGGRYLDPRVIQATGISDQEIARVTEEVTKTLRKRALLYRGNRPPLKVEGKTVILVDDGIATGASVYAAIQAARQMNPANLVLAVPVGPAAACAWLRNKVDELICLHSPENFYAVGQFYRVFSQVEDEEVQDLLECAGRLAAPKCLTTESVSTRNQDEVSIDLDDVQLKGILNIPDDSKEIVLFVHGSGSSRHSSRNLYVAQVLQAHGISTLLFDLLTNEEELYDRANAELRFDIDLLTRRLVGVTQWITRHPIAQKLAIGYFGASTGAAAALAAAGRLPSLIAAVVSRGGRPDLAGSALNLVRAPVLLIVGEKDEMVIGLNRQAFHELTAQDKQLIIVPGATHLFEEAGALEKVAQLAQEWFSRAFIARQSGKESSIS